MAWDEWEQLKKEAAERSRSGPVLACGATHEATREPEKVALQDEAPSGAAKTTELTATERMERIRHVIECFRDTTVLVPVERGEGFLTADVGGVRWIYAFTDEVAVARFHMLQGGTQGKLDCISVLGWRLLDVVIPAVGVPCGVALDVGSEGEGVLFPPVVGIVPDAAAVDASQGEPR